MTHADSGLMPLGRSRDTGVPASRPTSPASPPTLTRQRVALHVWGATRADADRAKNDALTHPASRLWDVEPDVTSSIGAPCPIRRRDPDALEQGADFHRAWAVYPAAAA